MTRKLNDLVDLSDSELVKLAQQGEREAFGVLYCRYSGQVLRYALRRVEFNRVAAEDVAAETWASALAKLPAYEHREARPVLAWLFGLAKALVWRGWDHDRYEVAVADAGWDDAPLYVSDDAEGETRPYLAAMRAAMVEGIEHLAPRQRQVVCARLAGNSDEVIAARLGISVEQVAAASRNAAAVLRRRLAPGDTQPAAQGRRQTPVQSRLRMRPLEQPTVDPDALRAAAQELPAAARRIALLKLDGRGNRDIAAELDCAVGTVASAWNRACLAFIEAGLMPAPTTVRPLHDLSRRQSDVQPEPVLSKPVSLAEAVAQLAPAARRVVELKLSGLSDKQAAAALGRSMGTVASTWSRAKRVLCAHGVLPAATPAAVPAALPAAA
ncbi:RNA polymerase sigma factor [Actinocatenispora rupis]|uniref:RNA polymerase sigma-70 factor, ECF subfamily n=1 Tax=Actinocatenispora rupis TaxID=519421 RepID=A0A8J3NA79_9ACTN|nr:sigma factor-like helix-turn-helix DNA-binding protein [Actinocatenispora rupis]GID11826.1 hypothetical protein Aru02nite_27150 [Actinocatenispora rupis]